MSMFKSKKTDSGISGYSVVLEDESGSVVPLRGGLLKSQADIIAAKLEDDLGSKLTNPKCGTCGGVGGCYMCDS